MANRKLIFCKSGIEVYEYKDSIGNISFYKVVTFKQEKLSIQKPELEVQFLKEFLTTN